MPDELIVILGVEVAILVFVAALTLHARRMDVLSGRFFETSVGSPVRSRRPRSVRMPARALQHLTRSFAGVARMVLLNLRTSRAGTGTPLEGRIHGDQADLPVDFERSLHINPAELIDRRDLALGELSIVFRSAVVGAATYRLPLPKSPQQRKPNEGGFHSSPRDLVNYPNSDRQWLFRPVIDDLDHLLCRGS